MAGSKTTTSTVQMDDGIHLLVKILGNDSATKPLFIGLHGAPGLSTHAEPEAGFAFLTSIFRVLVFDARGSGASDLTGPLTHDRWVKDIENLRQWAEADKFVLSGGSYGGAIALDYAVLHDDKLLGLILRDTWTNGVLFGMTALAAIVTSPRLNVDVSRQIRVWSGTLRDDKDYENAVQEIIPIYAAPGEDNDMQKDFEGTDKSSRYNSATQNAAFAVNMPRFDVRHQLKDIKVPTLVVVGRHDRITPVEFSEEIANGIPGARLETFDHSGHNPPGDEPERFQKTVLEFLRAELL